MPLQNLMMTSPAIPADEEARLARLVSIDALYTPAEERFDRITRLARQFFNVETCLISLVGRDEQWFKSRQGLNVACTKRSISFCGHAILGETVMVVEDALGDDRFERNPLVTGPPFIRFYAGYPLLAQEGSAIGTLCLIDSTPRVFARHQVQSLEDFGAWVELELQRRPMEQRLHEMAQRATAMERQAMLDSLTGMWNRAGLDRWFELQRNTPNAVIVLDLDHFKTINDTWGHLVGDTVLREVADRIRHTLRPEDFVARYGGEEFVICLPHADLQKAQLVAQRLRSAIADEPLALDNIQCEMTASLGIALYDGKGASLIDTFAAADEMLFAAKQAGRNQVRVMLADSAPMGSRPRRT
jgi:diguanylate cyclase (GGDEF)-like protein